MCNSITKGGLRAQQTPPSPLPSVPVFFCFIALLLPSPDHSVLSQSELCSLFVHQVTLNVYIVFTLTVFLTCH